MSVKRSIFSLSRQVNGVILFSLNCTLIKIKAKEAVETRQSKAVSPRLKVNNIGTFFTIIHVILNFQTDTSRQTVIDPDHTALQSDQGLHCLLFHLHLLDTLLSGITILFKF